MYGIWIRSGSNRRVAKINKCQNKIDTVTRTGGRRRVDSSHPLPSIHTNNFSCRKSINQRQWQTENNFVPYLLIFFVPERFINPHGQRDQLNCSSDYFAVLSFSLDFNRFVVVRLKFEIDLFLARLVFLWFLTNKII